MMNKFSLLLLSLIFFSSSPLAFATVLVPTPPPIAARNYILQDFYSGKIFMKKNADERIEPASLTKLMTAYLVFQKLRIGKIKLTDKVKISEKAQNMSEYTSRMYLEVGTEVQVELLLKGMIIQSGNDASIALAELIGGTEEAFATLMNAQAQRLGLKNTHYMNSTGLPSEEHYSSASDTALLAYALVRHFPEYYRWYSEREFTFNEITQKNRNLLLRRDPSVDGIKTGHTSGAGYCLAASAKRGEMRLISVIMGAKSEKARAKASEKMLDYGYQTVTEVFYPEIYPGTSEITSAINNGVSIISYRGWGDANGWHYPYFHTENIEDLNNGPQTPVMTSIVCNTGDFANSVDPCFGEKWMRVGTPSVPKGGVAFVGPSDLHTNTKYNNAIFAGFYSSLLDDDVFTFAAAVQLGKQEMYNSFPMDLGPEEKVEFNFYVYNILSDPSLEMWTKVPEAINVTIPDELTIGTSYLNLSLPGLNGAVVTAIKENETTAAEIVENDICAVEKKAGLHVNVIFTD